LSSSAIPLLPRVVSSICCYEILSLVVCIHKGAFLVRFEQLTSFSPASSRSPPLAAAGARSVHDLLDEWRISANLACQSRIFGSFRFA
jgi:hypothetical protein